MFKKLILAAIILGIVGVSFVPMWTSYLAEMAFKKPELSDSPKMADKAIRLKMYFYMFSDARKIAEKAIIYFPESSYFAGYVYCAALCAEREKEYDAAIYWYHYFLERFPKHSQATVAKNALEKIKGVHK